MISKKKVYELLAELKAQMTTQTEIKIVEKLEKEFQIMDGEIWRDIEGYEGLYQVSNKGRVKSLHWKEDRLLRTTLDSHNYPKTNLCKNHVQLTYLVHVLVATAFIPNPDNKPVVNHKDCDKENNCVENLEWVTYSENLVHAIKMGRKIYKKKSNKSKSC